METILHHLYIHVHLLHPKVVHFPIALFISAMGLEAVSSIFRKESFHRTAVHMYILATLLTPLVVLTGLSEAEHLNIKHPVLDLHKNFALLTMWGSLISLPILWLIKKHNSKILRFLFLVLTLTIVVFVSIAGHNGGRMVYEYNVGVEQ